VLIRREATGDVDAVREVTRAAFRDGLEEPVEPALLDALRADRGWIPSLSLVAQREGRIVGHVVCTRARVGSTPAVGLGPVSVLPHLQYSGVGTALMHAVLATADALGEPLVGVLGDPAYYERFGFMTSTELGIESPDPNWGRNFLVRILTSYDAGVRGRFEYAQPFQDL
jgi:putative acetyltransferase